MIDSHLVTAGKKPLINQWEEDTDMMMRSLPILFRGTEGV